MIRNSSYRIGSNRSHFGDDWDAFGYDDDTFDWDSNSIMKFIREYDSLPKDTKGSLKNIYFPAFRSFLLKFGREGKSIW